MYQLYKILANQYCCKIKALRFEIARLSQISYQDTVYVRGIRDYIT